MLVWGGMGEVPTRPTPAPGSLAAGREGAPCLRPSRSHPEEKAGGSRDFGQGDRQEGPVCSGVSPLPGLMGWARRTPPPPTNCLLLRHTPSAPSVSFILPYTSLFRSHTGTAPLLWCHTHTPLTTTHNHLHLPSVTHSTITHTHTHLSPCYNYTHAGCHTRTLPCSYSLGVICTCSLFPVHPRSPNLSPVIHPPPLVAHTPPLMSLLHTSMCHTQPQPLWSHTHTIFWSHTLTSFSWSHPTPTRLCHILNCRPLIRTASQGSRPEPAHSASPTHTLTPRPLPLLG